MQLTIREVSTFLSVPESTVSNWIKHRGLPAQHVGGQYRLNRAELLEWANANRIKVAVGLFDQPKSEAEAVPSLVAALEAGGVFHQLPETSKDKVLQALVQVLPLPDGIDREFLLQLFLAREACASTGIGDGIAIPHVRNPIVLNVTHPMVTLCFLEKPIDFGALDGKPVDVLFSLICPTMRSHLQLLSRLAHALHDEQFKAVVKRRGTRAEVLLEARRVEEAVG